MTSGTTCPGTAGQSVQGGGTGQSPPYRVSRVPDPEGVSRKRGERGGIASVEKLAAWSRIGCTRDSTQRLAFTHATVRRCAARALDAAAPEVARAAAQ